MRESSPSHTISPSLGVDGPTGVAPRFGLWRRGWPLLVLALLLCAALNLPATLKYSPASVDEPPVYVRFWPPESGESLTYRWSRGGSGLRLYGLEAVDGALVTLRLTAPQGSAAGPSLLTLALGERALATVEAPPAWRTYRVLVPAEGEGWRAPLLRLEGDTRRAGPGDSREIGVAVSALSAAPLGRMAPLAAAERWAYLCALLSGLLLWLWRLAPPRLPGLVAVVLATCAAAAAVLAPAWAAWRLPVDWPLAAAVAAGGLAVQAPAQVARGRSRTSWRVALGLLLAAAGQALFTQPGCTLPAAALLFGGLVAATAALWPPVDVGVPRERPRLALADLLICTALAAVLLPVFLADLSGARTSHEDEAMWTTVGSGAFHTFFIERDLFGPFWREHYNTWGYYNPQVGKYLIGASLYAAGYQEKLDVSPEPIADVGLLAAARLPSALLGVASCLALYGVVTLVSDRRHGLLASGLMAGGSLLPLMSARAMVDAPALAFSMLGLLGTLLTLRALRAGQQRAFLLAATTGAACGLAAGVKLNGGLVFGVAVLALALEAVLALRSGRSPLAALACLGVAGAWAWAMFFATNPFLYPDPLGGVREMQKFNAFVGGFSLETPRIPQGKVRALWDSVSTYGPLGRAGLPGDQLLLLAGALRLALAARDPGEWWRRSWGPLALWVLVSYVMIGLWLPVDWDRYYLPLQPVNAALQALGVLWAADAALALARRPAAGRQPGESSVERAP